MSSDPVTAARGLEMTDDDIDEFLRDVGYGILSLARDGEAYGIPISFGYDGEQLYFALIRFGDESEKLDFIDETTRGCLTATRVDGRFDWTSVVVRGSVDPVPSDRLDELDRAMEENAWHPSLFPPTEPMTGVERFEMRIDAASGRQVSH